MNRPFSLSQVPLGSEALSVRPPCPFSLPAGLLYGRACSDVEFIKILFSGQTFNYSNNSLMTQDSTTV